jgi:GntR family transcriptional regulator, vanillate catabolism transcriptional regulator
LARAIEMLNGQPFAGASAMLPMQSSVEEGQQFMRLAHQQHHSVVQAIEHGQGFRAQALCEEHVQIARRNLQFALESPEVAMKVMPGIRLMTESSRSFRGPREGLRAATPVSGVES